jgi:putative ABC transport system substrate-binding protein
VAEIKRRRLVLGAGAAAGCTAFGAFAQSSPSRRKLGCLWFGTPTQGRTDALPVALFARLRELGWTEGRNLVVIERFAEADASRFKALAAELASEKVDVIHAVFSSGVRAAREAAPGTPIVFSIVGDPVEDGLVASLARPGGNITGASTRDTEIYPKRVQIAKELLPRAERFAVLLNPPGRTPFPRVERALQELVTVGEQLGVKATRYYAKSIDDLEAIFDQMVRDRSDAVIMLAMERTGPKGRPLIVAQAARTRLPAIYPWSPFVDEGGLMAYSQSPSEPGRRAANYIDKILRGARPADLPVEEANVFELAINQRTARAIGLTIPPSLLLRADRIIE